MSKRWEYYGLSSREELKRALKTCGRCGHSRLAHRHREYDATYNLKVRLPAWRHVWTHCGNRGCDCHEFTTLLNTLALLLH